jgi:hypothetical protein
MSDDSIILTPKHNGKVGVYFCGVTREGFIAVAGEPRDIADGEEIMFDRSGIKASRDGSEYMFSRI